MTPIPSDQVQDLADCVAGVVASVDALYGDPATLRAILVSLPGYRPDERRPARRESA